MSKYGPVILGDGDEMPVWEVSAGPVDNLTLFHAVGWYSGDDGEIHFFTSNLGRGAATDE